MRIFMILMSSGDDDYKDCVDDHECFVDTLELW